MRIDNLINHDLRHQKFHFPPVACREQGLSSVAFEMPISFHYGAGIDHKLHSWRLGD